jgi:hypothetical protein
MKATFRLLFWLLLTPLVLKAQYEPLYVSKQTGESTTYRGSYERTTDNYEQASLSLSASSPMLKYAVSPSALSINPKETKSWTGTISVDAGPAPAPGQEVTVELNCSFQVKYSRPGGSGSAGSVVETYRCNGCGYHNGVRSTHEIVSETGSKAVPFKIYSILLSAPDTLLFRSNKQRLISVEGYPAGGKYSWSASGCVSVDEQNIYNQALIKPDPSVSSGEVIVTYSFGEVSYKKKIAVRYSTEPLAAGTPDKPGYWSQVALGGDGPYYLHPGTPADRYAGGPGYYDRSPGNPMLGDGTTGPWFWHPPEGTPYIGTPEGDGYFSLQKPESGVYTAYYLHPGIPGNSYTYGPGYYDHNPGNPMLGDGTTGPWFWMKETIKIPPVDSSKVKPKPIDSTVDDDDMPLGMPTKPGRWSPEKFGGDGPYYWHPGKPGFPGAKGPGYYNSHPGDQTVDDGTTGPMYWHPPQDVLPLGIPAGKGSFSHSRPATGNYPAYYFHPGIPGNPETYGPGYYDHYNGGTYENKLNNGTSSEVYWIPDTGSTSPGSSPGSARPDDEPIFRLREPVH